MENNIEISPARRWSGLMLLMTLLSGAGIWLLIWAESAHLPWYLQIPLAGLALTLIGGGALAIGWAYWHHELELRRESSSSASSDGARG